MRSQLGIWLAALIWSSCASTSDLTSQRPEFWSRNATEFWLVGALAASRCAAFTNQRPRLCRTAGMSLKKFLFLEEFSHYFTHQSMVFRLCLCFWCMMDQFMETESVRIYFIQHFDTVIWLITEYANGKFGDRFAWYQKLQDQGDREA